MFFALDNAAEYGHWVVDDKAAWLMSDFFEKVVASFRQPSNAIFPLREPYYWLFGQTRHKLTCGELATGGTVTHSPCETVEECGRY